MKYLCHLGLLAAVLLFSHCKVSAQNSSIDSLKIVLAAGPQDTILIKVYNELSIEYWNDDSDSSIHYSQMALQMSKELGYDAGLADAWSNMAQAYIYSGQYDLGQKSNSEAQDLYKKLNDHIALAEVLNQTAAIYNYKGKYDSAIAELTSAIKIFEEHNYLKGQASSYNTLGNILQKKGDYPQASEYLHKSLAINQKIGNSDGTADVLNNIGVIYEYQEEYEKALNNYRKSYLVYKKKGNKLGIAIGLHNAGIILKKTGYLDSAIYNFKTALEIDNEIGSFDGITFDKKELGETYLLMGNLDTAYIYLHSALRMTLSFQDPVLTIPTLTGIGNIHRMHHNYDSAQYYLKTAIKQAEKSELQNEKKEAVKSLYELFDQQGDTKRAFHYFKIYTQIKDELFNKENVRKLASAEAEYKFEQRRNEQEQQMYLNDLKKNRQLVEAVWVRNSSVIGLFAISMLAFLLYYNYRNKRRDNKKLNTLNQEIKNINSSLENKVSERTKQLESSLHEIEFANQELDMFIYRSAHNLRAPVANMLGLCQLGLINGESNYKEYFAQLKATVEKMDYMLSHLQRTNALKNRDFKLSTINIQALITNVLIEKKAPSGYKVKSNGDKNYEYKSDSFFLNILFENIIENAMKFSSGEKIVLDIEINHQNKADKELIILISDTGPGIENTIQNKIFDMFFRGIDKEGFGLGLYESQIIVHKLQGSLNLLKSSKLGSTFEIRLPKSNM